MAERKSDGDHGAPQRAHSDLKDVVKGVEALTNEVRKLREAFESSVKSDTAKDVKTRFARFGANIVPKKVK